MKYLKVILLILITILYFGNYHICEYFYPGADQINKWDSLKHTNYNIIIALCLYTAMIKSDFKNLEIFLTSVLSSIIISNIVDRLFFDSKHYEWNDIFVVVVIILISIFEYRRKWQKEKQ